MEQWVGEQHAKDRSARAKGKGGQVDEGAEEKQEVEEGRVAGKTDEKDTRRLWCWLGQLPPTAQTLAPLPKGARLTESALRWELAGGARAAAAPSQAAPSCAR